MNKVILIGNLASDVELKTTTNGTSTCSFRLAVQRRFANAQGVREADFLQIIAWRQTAELCAKYLAKGRKVGIEGNIQARSYMAQDGTKRYVTEIIADNVEFLTPKNESAGSYQQADSGLRAADTSPGDIPAGFTPVNDDELPF